MLCTLEAPGVRFITMDAQRFAPGREDEDIRLFPTYFCRECGQEYHPVQKMEGRWFPREIDDPIPKGMEELFGFLVPAGDDFEFTGEIEALPDFWLDWNAATLRVKSTYASAIPVRYELNARGEKGSVSFWYLSGHVKFCPKCGLVHESSGKDINRLTGLSGEGRSSATTMITLSVLQNLFSENIKDGEYDPRKMLGFTDNRQDAALQSGHFNDFIFLVLMRSSLLAALAESSGVLTEEVLVEKVFLALGFDRNDISVKTEFLQNPRLMGFNLTDSHRAVKFVLGYRLLRDMRKGWRHNNPPLEQLGLLSIGYSGIDAFASDSALFPPESGFLGTLDGPARKELFLVLFNEMRKNLCIDSRYLNQAEQEQMKNTAFQYLLERWSFGLEEKLQTTRYITLSPIPKTAKHGEDILVSGGRCSRLLRNLKRAKFWKQTEYAQEVLTWKEKQLMAIIDEAFEKAEYYGYVSQVEIAANLSGWALKAGRMEWSLPDTSGNESDKRKNVFSGNCTRTLPRCLKAARITYMNLNPMNILRR